MWKMCLKKLRKMRNIKYIVVHCTAGSQRTTIDGLRLEFKRKGWKNPGYHYVVEPDGKIHQLLDDEGVSNGVKGFNSVSINVAYIGGIDLAGKPVDNRTREQKWSMRNLLRLLKGRYPNAVIKGHRDFSPDLNRNGKVDRCEWIKACPCFDAMEEYKDL